MTEQTPQNLVSPQEKFKAWGLTLRPYGCPECGQVYLYGDGGTLMRCPNCARADLVLQNAALPAQAPEMQIPFEVQPQALQGVLDDFVNKVWLKPDDFTTKNLRARLRPVFWPMWMVDSTVTGEWQGEVGYDYQVKSSQEYYDSGRWKTRELTEGRIRWEPRLGRIKRRYDNAIAQALEDHERWKGKVGSYQFKRAKSWQPAKAKGTLIQLPDMQKESSWPAAEKSLTRLNARDCKQASEGQHIRNYSLKAGYESQNWTLFLLPFYAAHYQDDDGEVQAVYINGQSSHISGVRRASTQKGWKWSGILAGLAILMLLIALAGFALGVLFPPVAVLGIVLSILALILGIAAIVPIVWVWRWNSD